MEQDPNDEIVASFQDEMAARNGKGKPVDLNATVKTLRQLGRVIYELKRSELSCEQKIMAALLGIEETLHQLINQLNVYMLERELEAKEL